MGASQAGNPSFSNIINVTVDGKKLPTDCADLLVGGWVDLGAGVPGAFRLTFRDPHGLVLGKLNVRFGSKVVISPVAGGKGAASPVFTGEVTGMETDYDGTGTFTVVRGYDAGHRLMRVRRVAAYRNQTAADIARKLAGTNGVPIGQVQSTKTVYDFISQSNVTDWDFLARLADENEMVMSLDAKGKFQFVKPKPASGAAAPSPPGKKSPFELQGRGGRPALPGRRHRRRPGRQGRGARLERHDEEEAHRDDARRAPTPVSPSAPPRRRRPAPSRPPSWSRPTPRTTVQTEVTLAAGSLADDITSSFAELEVMVRGNPLLRPGVPITLSDVGTPFEGKYTCTSVRHTFGDGSHYETWVTVSGRQWRSLFGLTSGGGSALAPAAECGQRAGHRRTGPAEAGPGEAPVPVAGRRVRQRLDADRAAGRQGRRRDLPAGRRRRGAGRPSTGARSTTRSSSAASTTAATSRPRQGRVAARPGSRRRRSGTPCPTGEGNRVDLLSQQTGAAQAGRPHLATGNDRLIINLDRTKTEITVDSKGAVTIKGGTSVSVRGRYGSDPDRGPVPDHQERRAHSTSRAAARQRQGGRRGQRQCGGCHQPHLDRHRAGHRRGLVGPQGRQGRPDGRLLRQHDQVPVRMTRTTRTTRIDRASERLQEGRAAH